MALPLYNLDLSYNLFKRVRRSCQSEFSIPIEINNVHERIARIYEMVEEELQHEEEEYKDLQQNENKFMYKEIFTHDPYIMKFRELSGYGIKDESGKDKLTPDVKAKFLEQMKILYLGTGKLDSLVQIGSNVEME